MSGAWRRGLGWALAVLLGAAVYGGLSTYTQARRNIRHLTTDIHIFRQEMREQGRPSLTSTSALRRDIEELEGPLRVAAGLAHILPAPANWPWLTARTSLVKNGLAAAIDLRAVAWWALLRMESAAENYGLVNTATGIPFVMHDDPVVSAIAALKPHEARLQGAQQALEQAARDLARGGGRLAHWAPRIQACAWALELSSLLPRLVAQDADGPASRLYLLLLQNSDELRATGGFISSVVALRFDGARLISLDTMNSYDILPGDEPHPSPPSPLQEVMQAEVLLFRDANWSPDFPSSAAVLASLYQLDTGQPVSGIIALDTFGVRALLSSLGPIQVPGYDVTVTDENVVEAAIAFWEAPLDAPSLQQRQANLGAWLAHRKDFGGALMRAVQKRVEQLPARQWLELVATAREAAAAKHIMVWLADEPAQRALLRAGLAGEVQRASGDYLMVVDTNMGWNKVDRYIDRSLTYTVNLSEQPEARACATYRHTAETLQTECLHRAEYLDTYEALAQQCYWNYARLLAPSGSILIALEGSESAVETETESGKISWGGLVVTPPQEERTLCASYRPPVDILQAQGERLIYRLTVQKQSGTEAAPIHVTVQLPQNAQEIEADPPWRLAGTTLVLDDALQTDRTYTLSWRTPR